MSVAATPKGRPSRRRRILRTFVWTATLFLMFFAITVIYLRSISFESRLTGRAIREARQRLERDVVLERARLEFLPPGVVLEGLRIAGPEGLDRPLFAARRLEIGFVGLVEPGTLYRRSVGIGRIVAEAPEIHLVLDEDGELHLPEIFGGGGGEGPTRQEIPVAGVLITDGLIELEGKFIPLEVETGGLRLLLERTPRGHLVGEATAERLRLVVPNGRTSEGGEPQASRPIVGSVRTRVDLSTEKIAIERFRLLAEALDLRADGAVSWGGGPPRVDMAIVADGDLEQLTDWTFLEPLPSGGRLLRGPFTWDGTLAWVGTEALPAEVTPREIGANESGPGEPSTWSVAGKLRSPKMEVERLTLTSVDADTEVDPQRVGVRLVRASLLGGQVEGTTEIDLRDLASETARTGRTELHFDLVDPRQVMAILLPDMDLPLGGSLKGPLQYTFALDDPFAGSGRADLIVDPNVGPRGENEGARVRPVRAELPLLIENGVVLSEALSVRLPGQRATSRLRLDLRTLETRLTANVQSYDLAALVELGLPQASVDGAISGSAGEEASASADPLQGFRPVAGRGAFDVDLNLVEGATRIDVAFEMDQPVTERLVLDSAVGTLALDSGSTGSLQLHGLEARLERGEGAALVIVTPTSGEPVVGNEFGVDLEAWPLASLVRAVTGQEAQGSFAQLDGAVGGHLRWLLPASGVADSSGEVDARIDDFSYDGLGGLPLGVLEFQGRLGDQAQASGGGQLALLLEKARLQTEAGPIDLAGRMSVPFASSQASTSAASPPGVPATSSPRQSSNTTLSGTVDLALEAKTLDLTASPFSELFGLDDRERWLTIAGTVKGALAAPDADLLMSVTPDLDSVAIASEDSQLRVAWRGGDGALQLEGALADLVRIEGAGVVDRSGVALQADISGDSLGTAVRAALLRGDIDPDEDFGVPGQDPLDRIVAGDLDGEYRATLELRGGGSQSTEAELRIDALEARLPPTPGSTDDELRLAAEEPFTIRWRSGEVGDSSDRLAIEGLWLRDEVSGAEIIVVGSAENGGSQPAAGANPAEWQLDFGLQGVLPSAWVESFAPAIDIDGRIELLAVLKGTSLIPHFDGQVRMRDGEVRLDGFPHAFEDLDWTVLLYPDRLVLDRLAGRLGDGPLRASGDVQFVRDPPTPPARVALPRIRFDARVEDAALRWPEGWSLRGGAELAFRQSEAGDRVVVGEAKLDRARSLSQLDLSLPQLLRGMFERRRLQVQETDPLLDTVRLNVEIEGSEALRIENDVARLSGSVDLIAQGTLGRPVIFGEVGLDPGGTVSWGGEDYELTRGVLTFSNPYEIDPLIDIVAVTKRRDYDVVLALSGDRERLEANLTSDPPLPELEVLSLLAAGGTTGGSDTGLGPTRGTARSVDAADLLYSQASTLVGDRFTRLFGLDRFRLDPLTTGDTLSSARVTIGKRLSSDLFVTYSADPSSSENSILEVEWEVDENVVLVLRQNADGTYSADLRVEHVF